MAGMTKITRILAAGERTSIDARGTTIYVRRTTEQLLVSPRSTQVGQGAHGAQGVSYSLFMSQANKWFTAEEYDSVEVENIGTASTTVELYLGFGDFFQPVPDIVNVALSIPAARTITTVVDKINIDADQAGKEQLAAENLNRTVLIVTALATNAVNIRVGDTNVDNNRGTPLAPGETLAIENTGAVFACSESTNDQAAAVTEFATE